MGRRTMLPFEELLTEQEAVQAGKDRGRTLDEYDQHFFHLDSLYPGQRRSEIRETLKTIFQTNVSSVRELLHALVERKGERIQWADQGGGLAVPMRQLSAMRENVHMVNVDLFDWGPDAVVPEVRKHIEKLLRASLDDESKKPTYLKADMAVARLEEPSDLITSCESIQYLDDPLAAICNWYNQLADDGLLLVAAEHNLANWIRYDEAKSYEEQGRPLSAFLETLRKGGIRLAAHDDNERAPGLGQCYRRMMLVKSPGTELRVNARLVNVWTSPHKYKAAYYDSAENPVEVVES